MSVSSIDVLHPITEVVFARVKVLMVRIRWDVGRRVAMRVSWENLGERVPHLQLPVERSVEVSLHWIKTTILSCSNCSW